MERKIEVTIILALLLAVPLILAGAYGSGSYNAGDYAVGEVPSSSSSSGGSSGGGSSSGGGTSSTVVNESISIKCELDSDCNLEEGEVCWFGECTKLFDLKIINFESPIKLGESFEFTYFMKGMANISGDVEVHFWIEKEGEVVTSGHDTIYVGSFEEKTEKTKLYLPTSIDSGVYTFYIQLIHANYEVNTHRTIELVVDKETQTATVVGFEKELSDLAPYIISILVALIILILLFVIYKERKKIKSGIKYEKNFIQKHKIKLCLAAITAIFAVLIFYLSKTGIISFAFLGNFFTTVVVQFKKIITFFSEQSASLYIILGAIVLMLALIIFVVREKRKYLLKKFWEWKKQQRVANRKIKKEKIKSAKSSAASGKKFFEKIRKCKNELIKFLRKNKKQSLIVLGLILAAGIVFSLFYFGILTTEKLASAGKSFSDFFSSLFSTIGNFLSSAFMAVSVFTQKYLYYILGAILVIVIFTVGIIFERKNHFIKKISLELKRKRAKLKKLRLRQARINNRQLRVEAKREVVRARQSAKLRKQKIENFEKFIQKNKLLLLIIGIAIAVVVLIFLLSYFKIIPISEISQWIQNSANTTREFFSNFANSIRSISQSLISSIKTFAEKISSFAKNYLIYLILFFGIIALIFVIYLKRKILRNFLNKTQRNFKTLPKSKKRIILIALIAFILGIFIFWLFYSHILSLEQFKIFFSKISVALFGIVSAAWNLITDFSKNSFQTIKTIISKFSYLVVQNYIPIISGILILFLCIIFYLKRKILLKFFLKPKKLISKNKKISITLLAVLIILLAAGYLFYINIISINQIFEFFKNLLETIVNFVQQII